MSLPPRLRRIAPVLGLVLAGAVRAAPPATVDGIVRIELKENGVLGFSSRFGGANPGPLAAGECRASGGGAPARAPLPAEDAGVLTLAGDHGRSLRLVPEKGPNGDVLYAPVRDRARPHGRSFGPGDRLVLTATGGAVPAFRAELRFPAPLELTSPTELDATQPQVVTWKPGPGEVRLVYRHANGSSTVCSFPRAAGRAVLPERAPRRDPRPTEGHARLTVEPHAVAVVVAGARRIVVDASAGSTPLSTR